MASPKTIVDRRSSDPQQEAPVRPPSRTFSPEIHGVRGLALTMVVAFHLFGQGRVSGGVDVFLVISAYLMTGSLLRSIDMGRLSLVYRYGRTFSRLLPAALLTIVTTALVTPLVLPRSRWQAIFEQAKATALFQENQYLATTGLSYEAAGSGTSPFQHFWSLSMQGQFLLLWPAVAFLVILLGKRLSANTRKTLFVLFVVVVTALSFVYAIRLVAIDQPVAYYSLGARLWEFGLGGLAAFLAPHASRLTKFGGVAGWVGVAVILSSGLVTNGAETFPGPWALWPVAGALLVLFAADSGGASQAGFTRALSMKPIVWLANRGYPLYLWHWPILIFFLAKVESPQVSFVEAVLVLAGSFVLTEVTMRLVSGPSVRWANSLQKTGRGAFALVTTLTVTAFAVAGAAQVAVVHEERRVRDELQRAAEHEASETQRPGSESGLPETDMGLPLTPAIDVAEQDLPDIYQLGCIQNWRDGAGFDEVLVCPNTPGPNARAVRDPKRVVVSGGSHVLQFYPAFRQIADQEGWELIVIDKDGCRLAVDGPDSDRRQSCIDWNKQAIPEIVTQEPDAVITLGTVTSGAEGQKETVDEAQVAAWQALSDEGIPVLVFRDSPRFSESVPECLETATDLAACNTTRETVYEAVSPLLSEGWADLVIPLDFTHGLCDDKSCPAVVGNIVAYRDASHVTATFSRSLTPVIRAELEAAMPELFQ